MRRACAFTIVTLLCATFLYSKPPEQQGRWSRLATLIWAVNKPLTIPSPDGKKAIIVRPIPDPQSDATTVVSVKAYGREFETKMGELVNAEVLWSPASDAFFVTYSDGGNVGTYHLKVAYVTSAGLSFLEPSVNGQLFRPKCFEQEYPNVVGIRWENKDSSQLLVAVQVPPHSSCASMGTFRAYIIALPEGYIQSVFGQLKAKEFFRAYLGEELMNADDSCARKPETCRPAGMKTR